MVVTGKQLGLMRSIDSLTKEKGYAPSLRELREEIEVKSLSTVYGRLGVLARKGLVQRPSRTARSVHFTPVGAAILKHPQLVEMGERVIGRVEFTAFEVQAVQLRGCGDGREAA